MVAWVLGVGTLMPAAIVCGQTASATTTTGAEGGVGDLSTDRPGLGNGTEVVGRGVWQVETGLSLESSHDAQARARELAAPLALFRVGLTRQVELRLSADGLLSDTSSLAGSRRHSGGSDAQVGAKWKFADRHTSRLKLDLALIPIVSLPTGSNDFTSGGYDPNVTLAWAGDLPRGFDLSGNYILSSNTDDDRRFAEHDLSASLGHDLPAGWQGFAEVFTASALSRDGSRAWTVDAGVTRGLGDNAQFDVSAGRGLNDAASDWFVAAGFCLRGLPRRH
jgi:hypothetical protein